MCSEKVIKQNLQKVSDTHKYLNPEEGTEWNRNNSLLKWMREGLTKYCTCIDNVINVSMELSDVEVAGFMSAQSPLKFLSVTSIYLFFQYLCFSLKI